MVYKTKRNYIAKRFKVQQLNSIFSDKGQGFIRTTFQGRGKKKITTNTVHSHFIEIPEKASNGKIGLS